MFLARLLPTAAALFVMVFFSRRLPVGQYGDYQNFWVRYSLLTTITCAGIPSFLFSLETGRAATWHQLLSRAACMGFMLLVLACSAFFAVWEEPSIGFWIPALFLAVATVGLISEAVLLAEGAVVPVLMVNTIYAGAFIAAHIIWIRCFSSLQPLFAGILVLNVAKAILLLILWYRRSVRSGVQEALTAREKKLWAHIGVYDLLQQGIRVADKFLVSFLVVPSVSAIYFNGAQEVPFLPVLLGTAGATLLRQAAFPGTGGAAAVGWARLTGKLLSSIVFPLACWLFLFREEIFAAVFSQAYEASAGIFAMTLVVLPLRAYPFTALLQHYKRGDLINLGALLDLCLAFLLAPPLYHLMGLKGIALAFSLSTVLLAGFYLWQTTRITGSSWTSLLPLKNWIVKFSVFALALAIFASWNRTGTDGTARLILGAALALVLCGLSLISDLKRPQTHGRAPST